MLLTILCNLPYIQDEFQTCCSYRFDLLILPENIVNASLQKSLEFVALQASLTVIISDEMKGIRYGVNSNQ